MIEKMLTSYFYPDKSLLLKAADAILYPSQVVFNGKRIEFDSKKDFSRQEDIKASSLFIRILLIPVLLLMIPITFIACIIKYFGNEDEAFQPILDRVLNEDCAICYDTLRDGDSTVLKCRHIFHDNCIKEWIIIKPECPMCRAVVDI